MMLNLKSNSNNVNAIAGIFIALTLLSLWIVSLVMLLCVDISRITILEVAIAFLVRTFLHTGLFITAHDAMHGTVFPRNRQVNDLIGAIATTAYALLSYPNLVKKHRLHHQHPATADDPDFFESSNLDNHINPSHTQTSPWSWYFKFMQGYLHGRQVWIVLTGIAVIFLILNIICHISSRNLLLFWIMPMLGSSIQLFYFGTFLPHRRLDRDYQDRHRAKSTNLNSFWSFISCYYFGYHWEHHEHPYLPWYKLPSVRSTSYNSLKTNSLVKANLF